MKNTYQVLFHHIDKFWPERKKTKYTWQLGKMGSLLPRFSVVCVEPSRSDEAWIYVTEGAWEVDTVDKPRKEFFIMCPYHNARHVETLTLLVSMHFDERYRLDVGRAVDIGHSWLEGSQCDHLLISTPYPFGPSLENCEVEKNFLVQYLWALPITPPESDFLVRFGIDALERKFDEVGIDYLDPLRVSAV